MGAGLAEGRWVREIGAKRMGEEEDRNGLCLFTLVEVDPSEVG